MGSRDRREVWEVIGRLDASYGAPARAGALLRCPACRGRGWRIDLANAWLCDEHAPTEQCPVCMGAGQHALPMARFEMLRLEALGELPAELADEDGAVRPRRAARAAEPAA